MAERDHSVCQVMLKRIPVTLKHILRA
jgi:hypothetical protein